MGSSQQGKKVPSSLVVEVVYLRKDSVKWMVGFSCLQHLQSSDYVCSNSGVLWSFSGLKYNLPNLRLHRAFSRNPVCACRTLQKV